MLLIHSHTAHASYYLGARYCCQAFNIDIPRDHPDPAGRAIAEIKIILSNTPQGRRFDRLICLHKILPNGQPKQIWPLNKQQ